MNTRSGFQEIPHTADWALRVWAEDFPALLSCAAKGMYVMMEVILKPTPRISRKIRLPAGDGESLLVRLLGELLYLVEEERLGFDQIQVTLEDGQWIARMEGAAIASQSKLIKAVTYHKLEIRPIPGGLETTIVFDV